MDYAARHRRPKQGGKPGKSDVARDDRFHARGRFGTACGNDAIHSIDAPRQVMTHTLLLKLVVFAVIALFALARPTDIDYWWHVRTGDYILATHSIPATDVFTYTAEGRPWVVHEWLWEVMQSVVLHYGGYRAAAALSVALMLSTYAILYRGLRRLGAGEIPATTLTLWAAAIAVPNFGVRPREWTHLFVAVYLTRLLAFRAGQQARLWILPVVMLLWVNLHGVFALGVALIGFFATMSLVEWKVYGGEFQRRPWIVCGAVILATLMNPYGLWQLLYPLGYYLDGDNPSFAIVSEFASPDFHNPIMQLFALGIIAFAVVGIRTGRDRTFDALLGAIFILQALVSARQVSLSALVLAPLIAAGIVQRYQWARERPPAPTGVGIRTANAVVAVALGLAMVVAGSDPKVMGRLQLHAEPVSKGMPVEGAAFIVEHNLPDPVFNQQEWGGFLIYEWFPRRKVFIDGRFDMFGNSIVANYQAVANIQARWQEVLAEYKIETVLTRKNSPLSTLLTTTGAWDRVFRGEVEDVLVKRKDVTGGSRPE